MSARKPTTHRPKLQSKAEFARRTRRSKPTITVACNKGSLAPALVGGRIDVAHPAAKAYAKKCGIDPRALLDAEDPEGAPARVARRMEVVRLTSGELVFGVDVEGDYIVGTAPEVIASAARYGARYLHHFDPDDPEAEALIDLDHPATSEFLSKAWKRACTPDDLDRLWTELQSDRGQTEGANAD